MTSRSCLYLLLLVGATLASRLAAAPADLDLTFNGTGKALLESPSAVANDIIKMALQPDGKVVVSGLSGSRMGVLRFTTEGALDTSFNGTGGVASYYDGTPSGLVIQPDGKIVVGGAVRNAEESGLGAYRFNSDGTTDTGFGHLGLAIYPQSPFYSSDMIMQPDGRILVSGQPSYSWDRRSIFVGRFLPNGQVDTSFNETGLGYTPASYDQVGGEMELKGDGRILIGTNPSVRVLSFLADGRVDLDYYGSAGTSTPVEGAVIRQTPEGKLWFAGTRNPSGFRDFVLTRLDANGELDETFNGGALRTVDFGGVNDVLYCMAIQHNGKILLGGYSDYRLAIARLNPDGSLDTGFNGTGMLILEEEGCAHAICLQRDGKILVAGSWHLMRFEGDPTSAEIRVEQPADTALVSGTTSVAFAPAIPGGASTQTFTLKNLGGNDLEIEGLTLTGSGADDFEVSAEPVTTTVGSGQQTVFSLRFAPGTAGEKTAVLQVASNAANLQEFLIPLTGLSLAPGLDQDHDGVSNEAEIRLAALGFDPLADSSALRTLLHQNAAGAGLLGEGDMETLALNSVLLRKNPETGIFVLRLDIQKSSDLKVWEPLTGYVPTFDAETGKIELEIQPAGPGPQFYKVLGSKP